MLLLRFRFFSFLRARRVNSSQDLYLNGSQVQQREQQSAEPDELATEKSELARERERSLNSPKWLNSNGSLQAKHALAVAAAVGCC